jgi:HSP20 family protein
MANLIRRRESNTGMQQGRNGGELGWDPFRVMDALLRLDPFRGGNEGLWARSSEFMPTFDLKENKDSYVVRADLPGVKDSDIDVTVTGNVVTLSGRREAETREDGDQYHTVERSYGSFSRALSFPDGANLEDIRADLKDGVLTLTIPKRPEVQPKRISIGRGETAEGKGKA